MIQTLTKTRFEIDNSLTYVEPTQDNETPEYLLKSIKRSLARNKQTGDLHNCKIDADYLHLGYYSYLRHCWSHHAIPVISPEIIWQILMSVASERVCAKPDLYRDTFTRSQDKRALVVHGALDALPNFAEDIANMILISAPTDVSKLVPEFSTASELSRMAQAVALMSTASPYYDYCMMMCGLPAIEVRGTDVDWILLMESWEYLSDLLSKDSRNEKWIQRADSVLKNVSRNITDVETWKTFFTCERCGSGSDVTLGGWISQLGFDYRKGYMPVHALPSAVANADFKVMETQKHYRIFSGILGSKMNDGVAEPVYGYLLANLAVQ